MVHHPVPTGALPRAVVQAAATADSTRLTLGFEWRGQWGGHTGGQSRRGVDGAPASGTGDLIGEDGVIGSAPGGTAHT